MGRTEYWNDPAAPKPNSLVPAAGVLAVDHQGRLAGCIASPGAVSRAGCGSASYSRTGHDDSFLPKASPVCWQSA
jgi:hypothetical protein